jgi:hypothetical protein
VPRRTYINLARFGTFESIRATGNAICSFWVADAHTFCPSTIRSSPALTAWSASEAKSGSLNNWW